MIRSVEYTPKVSLILDVLYAARRRDNARAATTIFFEPCSVFATVIDEPLLFQTQDQSRAEVFAHIST